MDLILFLALLALGETLTQQWALKIVSRQISVNLRENAVRKEESSNVVIPGKMVIIKIYFNICSKEATGQIRRDPSNLDEHEFN